MKTQACAVRRMLRWLRKKKTAKVTADGPQQRVESTCSAYRLKHKNSMTFETKIECVETFYLSLDECKNLVYISKPKINHHCLR